MTKFIDVKKELTGFTLMEIIIVIVILGILAAIAIPMYTRTVEEQKGRGCKLNMISIFSAWRIYNMQYDPDYSIPAGDPFNPIGNINTDFGILVDERYFGKESTTEAGFYMETPVANTLRLSAERLSGTYHGNRISLDYDYSTGVLTENTTDTWPLSLGE